MQTETIASPSRRRAARLLAITAALSALPLTALGAVKGVPAVTKAQRRCFTSLCDTLVPADELTPAASALGVPEILLDDIAGVDDARRLLAVACVWLDRQAGGDFAARPLEARDQAVRVMAAQPWDSPPGRFFHLTRNSVMAEYYAQPAAWRGLALDRPPQPLGFMDAVG